MPELSLSSDPVASVLGDLSVETFLHEYWQKKPLLIRQAIPNFAQGLLDLSQLWALAGREDAIARLIQQKAGRWYMQHGPLKSRQRSQLPSSDWTVLVQNVNHFLPKADALLRQFNFIPMARLDDLMVSYAPAGGGIGAHVDSYDVFLLQAMGQKRWQIASNFDPTLVADAPLKILAHFKPEQEWILEAGDMLYLPPQYAHYGVALQEGMTYSIGFRAPQALELAQAFFAYLQDYTHVEGLYQDANLQVQTEAAYIGSAMQQQVQNMLEQVRWNNDAVNQFLGAYLSEPKAHIWFDSPDDCLEEDDFIEEALKKGLYLDLKTQLLYDDIYFYLNGEKIQVNMDFYFAWKLLANSRKLAAIHVNKQLAMGFYPYYMTGVLHICNELS